MGNFIVCVKGISGSGKSTRTYLLLKFLREVLGYKSGEFIITDCNGKQKSAGIIVKDLNLIFLGKEYNTGKIGRFQGLDAVTGVFGSNAAISDFLRDNSDKYSFFLEGAGTTQSHRFRPKFLYEYCGFKEVLMQYYNYGGEKNHEEYYNRIIYRSGKKPTRDTMWEKEVSYTKEVTFSQKEMLDLGDKCFVALFHNFYDENPSDLGAKYFGIFHSEDYSEEFRQYVDECDYIKNNSFINFAK
jgi:hypothetical protein